MDLSKTVSAIADDLRRSAEVGGEESARLAEVLVASLEPALRLHLLEALHEVAAELTESAAGWRVEVRLVDRQPAFSLVETACEPASGERLGEYAADELARLTVRIPEGLKGALERVAAERGASVNSWITVALAHALKGSGFGGPPPGRRGPRRMTGYIQG